jgi:hypothetical protein
VEQALSRGLIARGAGDAAFVLTRAGAQFLRRLIANEDAFRAQHQARAVRPLVEASVEGADRASSRPVLVDDAESPLGWLRRRKDKDGRPFLDETEFTAGERLRADFTFAQLTPRVTANWEATGGRERRGGGPGRGGEMRDNVVAARQRVRRALVAVGPELADILLDVCCFLKGLEEVERDERLSARSGKEVLRRALSALARHYGLICGGEAAERIRRKLAHWGAEDFRPGLEEWR